MPREQIVKGYEFAKDQYVIFKPEELKALEEKATHTIDIVEFVPLDQVDREYFDKVYYLGTGQGRRARLPAARAGAAARPAASALGNTPRAASSTS